ncbi:MAG: cellulase family glycosylhydrolase, partial [Aliifodinibius sp.]|nr:cellulase family glycosylhydrolase [Fodinibius sp.]NIW50346.1 cellulase family glycosylhydrolase [Gammaproteobacteria bacterium]NIX02041.1 cellulase family glycosylhydrolase [Phycisphaerae bacterium]NIY30496.1 cellulase family glycosylhydrolase [Fodinibius sp.]
MAFVGIAENKRHLTKPNGQPFFIMGANYEGYFDRAWQMWDDGKFNPSLIIHDFRKMADAGLNTVRLFVSPALENDVRANDFAKLDRVLQIAADHGQMVLMTFNDSHNLNLAEVAALDAKVAYRYQDDPIILGWDLENEPRFYNFAAAIYPSNRPAPIQTNVLVSHYEPRVSQQEAIELQNQRRIPGHLNPQHAFYYINGLRYFIEFAEDANRWGAQMGKTVVDYMYSTDSAKWHKLIEVLNGTVAAWLAVRHTPVRQADPNHLITVGYNWLYFAGLSANRRLDFQQFHHYGPVSLP